MQESSSTWLRLVRRLALCRWIFVAVAIAACSGADAATRSGGTINAGTRFETPYYIQDSGTAGPTVIITGGIHGNERAGAYAADQIRHWPIARGRIIVLPRANPPALQADKRHTPDVDEKLRNLNRNFPKAGEPPDARGTAAAGIWRFVQKHQPDWLIDLHEGYDFHQINPKSVGSSVIVYPTPAAKRVAPLLLGAINKKISEKQKKFVRRGSPIDSSLARAAGEHLGANAIIIETTFKEQALSKRARQHRIAVHRLLEHLKMLDPQVGVDWLIDRDNAASQIQVAMYDGPGAAGRGLPRLTELLGEWKKTSLVRVGPEEVRSGALGQFDVVIFPGGSGSAQARAIGDDGRRKVRQFVEGGGGYVGICGGAFLACERFTWGLKILDAKTKSPKWRRGRAMVEVELTDQGQKIFGRGNGQFAIKYHNGPILEPAGSKALPDYDVLAVFRTEVAENNSPKGIMLGSPAIVAGHYGKGRVICFSPHPEQSEELEDIIRRTIEWAAPEPP